MMSNFKLSHNRFVMIVCAFALAACQKVNTTTHTPGELVQDKSIQTKSVQARPVEENVMQGKQLVEQNCYICHSPSASHDSRSAPPMVAIKAHYLTPESTKESFYNDMKAFLDAPSKDKVQLKGAVRRFGVMPYVPVSDDDLLLIVNYLYDYQIEEPDWFKEHWESKQKKPYINEGKQLDKDKSGPSASISDRATRYAMETKQQLGKNLMQQLNTNGAEGALSFCNEQAYPLTNSVADKHNVSIKRITNKPRNVNNTATEFETNLIKDYQQQVSNGQLFKPSIYNKGAITTYYSPIVTNGMCMQCHGDVKKDIKPHVFSKIRELYPNDKAVGYSINQVRGLWKIELTN